MQRNMTFGSDEKRVAPLLRQQQHLTPQTHRFWVATYSRLTVFYVVGPSHPIILFHFATEKLLATRDSVILGAHV